MPIRYKVVLFLIAFLIIFVAKPTSLYADELTHPPIVVSVTGPTTGYYGSTYSFTVSATSADGYAITTLFLQNDGENFSSKSAGDSGCTATDCSFTGSFTPPTSGTFRIYAAINYTNFADSNVCNSYSGDLTTDCQDSGDMYMTFSVTNAPATPVVESITGPTSGYVGTAYSFSAVVSGTVLHPISSVNLNEYDSDLIDTTIASIDSGDSGCTDTSCTVSGVFTPTAAGTYIIYVAPLSNPSCSTAPGAGNLCTNSSGKYITFVATDAVDSTTPTTVTSITGPTSGIVGHTYLFSTTVASARGYDIRTLWLTQSKNPDSDDGSTDFGMIDAGAQGCTANSCTLTYSFTPSTTGTYYIYDWVTFTSGGGIDSCNTHPSLAEWNCLDSRGKYIIFVVTDGVRQGGNDDADSLPATGLFNNQAKNIFIGFGFVILGILTIQTPNIYKNINEKRVSKKKSTLEQNFK